MPVDSAREQEADRHPMRIRAEDMVRLMPEVHAIIPGGNFEFASTGWITLHYKGVSQTFRAHCNDDTLLAAKCLRDKVDAVEGT